MPRVVVIGDFSHWDATVTWNSIKSASDLDVVFTRILNRLPHAVATVESEYPTLLEHFRKSRRAHVSIDDYIGEEATTDALEKYREA